MIIFTDGYRQRQNKQIDYKHKRDLAIRTGNAAEPTVCLGSLPNGKESPMIIYRPKRHLVRRYLLNALAQIIGPITPIMITTTASKRNMYHRSVSKGIFLNAALAKPSNVVWNRYMR